MENNFYKDEFERFLQDQVKNHRMFPSDSVWKEINKKLHGNKNWLAFSIAGIVFLSAIIGVSVYFSPNQHLPANRPASLSTQATVQENDIAVQPSGSTADKNKPGKELYPYNTVTRNSGHNKPNNSLSGQIASQPLQQPNSESSANEDLLLANSSEKPASQNPVVNSVKPFTIAPDTKVADEQLENHRAEQINVDNFLQQHPQQTALFTTNRKISRKNKLSYQIYFTPSVSYRKLREDRSAEDNKSPNAGGPVARNYVADVNKIVRHTPGTGLEAGVSLRFNLSDKLKLTSALQFNVRKYFIEAYMAPTEVATIALSGSSGIDSVNTYAVYRTTNGYRSTQLQNTYYQLSIPIGMEWEVIGNKKISLNMAASLQPTYLLNRNAYLISTDFKNYTKSPQMLRTWNLNTNLEASVKFKSGDYNWQLGPQLRYQQLPTFIRQYPIKEHLLDYGIKLGVSKIIQ